MSCTICRTPILVHLSCLKFQAQQRPLIVSKVCPPNHQQYFCDITLLDRHYEGVVMQNLIHTGRGLFICTAWDISGEVKFRFRIVQEEIQNEVTIQSVILS